jgi:hypothetical protein
MNKKRKYGVLVTSAVNAKFSIYKPVERLAQTLETIKSIRERVPNAVICLTDCSVPAISDDVKAELQSHVDYFVDFSQDETVNWIAENITVQDVVKNMTELVVVTGFFEMAQEQGWFADCDRVFKVSGRYKLTDRFWIGDYQRALIGDKYVVSKRNLSQFAPGITGVDMQYMLRVYSLGVNRIPKFIKLLETMTRHMKDRVDAGGYIDIEHLWYKFLPEKDVIIFDRTGVTGNIGPNGQQIEN